MEGFFKKAQYQNWELQDDATEVKGNYLRVMQNNSDTKKQKILKISK